MQCQRERGLSLRGSCLPAPVYQNRNKRHQHPQLPLQSQLSPQSPTLGGSAQNKGEIGPNGRSNEEQMRPTTGPANHRQTHPGGMSDGQAAHTIASTRDGNHRQQHRPPSPRKIRLRTTNDEPNAVSAGVRIVVGCPRSRRPCARCSMLLAMFPVSRLTQWCGQLDHLIYCIYSFRAHKQAQIIIWSQVTREDVACRSRVAHTTLIRSQSKYTIQATEVHVTDS